jgi:lipoprotein-releasing system permease protein
MIGILKALGATNKLIRKLFFYNGIILVLKGLLIGNLIGIGLCLIQYWFHLIPLDQDNYHVNTVPIAWDLGWLVSLNILVISISALFLTFPTIVAAKMNPVKAIRFD